ncbi:Na(+)/H(+) exchange regulatory cofactor NHE-RF1 isoform X1 [Patella vulgata]|uniref:Na(+)/H(+) exchange regulatory cofactor NHE-RF1 isoform X1 n=1 Tax=Patella vulgata TaxID=6465 RepID=UPI0021806D5E|nr:Na(+)/H(+) exchange regulatory cofactor NHE-RF1 isoform X1 [Patella vulgata]
MSNGVDTQTRPRLCHIIKWPDFQGYGFNLHAEKGKAGQFIGKVDDNSPASSAGLKSGDRIVEVNDVNIGNENHQQVVQRVKAGGDQTKLLVVDEETDKYYKDEKIVVRGDLPEVIYNRTPLRPGQEEPPVLNVVEATKEETVVVEETPTPVESTNNNTISQYQPRLCHLRKWPDFEGYGFNLHAEKNKPGQYIGKVDEGSPAEMADLREHDRIIEVNNTNVEQEAHQNVIQNIRSGGDEARILVVDAKTDAYYKEKGIQVVGTLPEVLYKATPPRSLPVTIENGETEPEIINTDYDIIQEESINIENENEVVNETTIIETETVEETSIPEAEIVDTSPSNVEVEDYTDHTYENTDVMTSNGTSSTITETRISESEAVPAKEIDQPTPPVHAAEPEVPTSYSSSVSDPPTPTPEAGDGRPEGMSAREYLEYLRNKKKMDPRNQKVDFKQKYELFQKM